MFGRALLAAWAIICASILVLAFFPGLVRLIPYPSAIRPLLILLVLISLAYGIIWLYRQGMKRAKSK